ncbi:bifunctional riboflavin kinase/FAD synthetase [Agrococcus sp. ARC_14]|uniref:bifunctional riboflavin kinase/FAD synthetase n=1 Tax=Agrococcus sp. ARC_14 TaxID=2919927 RepID=UPI001F057EAF|nr:bifunctional riboflavin kinase/FAD synthetase [Agrococcus sp. ARC_14]MCH1883644.1 bifunctional riboflavin kinase/FAD synthetase [Agrococcus sp. ARC_14]
MSARIPDPVPADAAPADPMHWIDELEAVPSAVTIGKFDGVHIGHQRIIEQLRAIAEPQGLATTVVTFDRNPLEVVRPDVAPLPLVSLDHKLELLAAAGADRVIVIPFTKAAAAQPADEFATRVLFDGLGARVLLVGDDFRFGFRGAGTPELLRELAEPRDVRVESIDDICFTDGRRVSSTWIREALDLGRIREANEMLGRRHLLRGDVVRGFQRGRALGFPTANLGAPVEGFIPADGVYAGVAHVDAGTFAAAVSIGDNPTFDGVQAKTVEAYLLDVDLDLYDRPIALELVDFVRPMHRFEGLDQLIAQMHRDVEVTRETIAPLLAAEA